MFGVFQNWESQGQRLLIILLGSDYVEKFNNDGEEASSGPANQE